MQTINFYVVDEVHIALLYAIKCRRVDESLFWCQELYDSHHIDIIKSALFEGWLWYIGGNHGEWLYRWSSSDSSYIQIMELCYNLVILPCESRDISLFALLVSEAVVSDHPPDKLIISKKHIPIIDTYKTRIEATPIERYFIDAICQRKARTAWWAAQYIPSDRLFMLMRIACVYRVEVMRILREYEKTLDALYAPIIKCVCIIICSIAHRHISPVNLPENILAQLKEWQDGKTPRLRRIYKIPEMALYNRTRRGCIPYTENTISELSYFEPFLSGSYWDNEIKHKRGGKLMPGGKILSFKDDDTFDEFYSTIFVDDIPDEWSVLDQQKSHGDGVLSPGEKFNISKMTRIWFCSNISKFVWNFRGQIYSYLAPLEFTGCTRNFSEVGKFYMSGPRPIIDSIFKELVYIKKLLITK